ncbi:hypothetical protein V6N13_113888 [Hibiscus sabdariffa]
MAFGKKRQRLESQSKEAEQSQEEERTKSAQNDNDIQDIEEEEVTNTKVARCQTLLTNRAEFQRIRKKVEEAENGGISPSLSKSTLNNSHSRPTTTTCPIAKSFGTVERHHVDILIVRALCANGIPFNVLRNPDFLAMLKGVNQAPKDYKPPSFDRARTTLVDECQRELEKELIPVKDTWTTHGTSIVSDGWTNMKRQPLINVVASNSSGSMFMYAKDFTGQEKTGANIAEFLLETIEEVGSSNVLQVITDNAANYFAATFSWMSETYKRGKTVVKYFLNHEKANAIFKSQSDLELLKVAKTRFASHYLLLKRLSRCREALATTTVLRCWREWVNSGDERTKSLGRELAATIIDDEFWEEVDNILEITQPIYSMIRFADGEGEKMGEVYEKMDCMIGKIRDILLNNNKHVDDYAKMEEILVFRWEKMNITMHCLGFALNPFFYDSKYLNVEAPGGITRRAPNQDREVVAGVLKAFDRIGEDENEKAELRKQLAKFQNKQGMFGTSHARIDATTMSPISWWSTYGSETPELAEIAIRVLSQPIISSSAERV